MTRSRAEKAAYDKAHYQVVRERKIEQAKAWYAQHKEAKRQYDREYRPVKNSRRRKQYAENPEKILAPMRGRLNRAKSLRQYGLTPETFDIMLAAQDGRCACCGTSTPTHKKGWHVDHDHVTSKLRGILCGNCNTGIGMLGDNADGVRKALAYLERTDDVLAR